MEIYWNLENLKKDANAVLSVGTFDGIHLGHQSIIRELVARAVQYGGLSTLISFEPHPQLVLRRDNRREIKLLTTIDEKIAILKALGLQRLIVINFTERFSRMESEDFVKKILVERVGLRQIVIGHDHAFGRGRKGNIETLRRLGSIYDFTVNVIEPYSIDGEVVSSTKIRNFLASGQVAQTARFLGRNYSISGRVITGEGRGKNLRFPTANIQPLSPNKLIPKDGIYAALAKTGKNPNKYKGILNIGMRPTFNPPKRAVEIHLLNFDGELYGQDLQVEPVERIRDEIKFDSPEPLIRQMEMDREESLRLLANF